MIEMRQVQIIENENNKRNVSNANKGARISNQSNLQMQSNQQLSSNSLIDLMSDWFFKIFKLN